MTSTGPEARDTCVWEGAHPTVEFLANVLEVIGQPVFVKDRQFRWVVLNTALSSMLGFAPEEMLGKTDYDFLSKDQADSLRARDEKTFQAFLTPESVEVDEERITDRDGNVHIVETIKTPVRDATGTPTHLVGIVNDVTEARRSQEQLRHSEEELRRRVEARGKELRDAQQQLLSKERLMVIGQLSAGLAHQIRNPLGAISNALALVRRSLGADASGQVSEALKIGQDEVWAANRIISDLLDFARISPPQRTRLTLDEIVSASLNACDVPSKVIIERELSQVEVWVDERQASDAIANIIRNAIEAMEGEGRLSFTARIVEREAELTITDTGVGVSPATLELLFEPLITTKPLGFGLGLTAARALIVNNGGTLDCEAVPDRGARFRLRLPWADAPPNSDRPAAPEETST